MNEIEYQTNLIWAIRQACDEKNGPAYRAANLSIKPTGQHEQSPLNEMGKPYDVGIVLNRAYFVGMELKVSHVLSDGKLSFKSWNPEQFRMYKDLSRLAPLFYTYNLEYSGGEVLDPAEILDGSRISRPERLPGQFPSCEKHDLLSAWLDAWLDDPVKQGATVFDNTVCDGVPLIYDIVEYNFPNVIWLIVLSSPKLVLRSAVTNHELFKMVVESAGTWSKRKSTLQRLTKSEQFAVLLTDVQVRFDEMLRDYAQQMCNENEMDDKPALTGRPQRRGMKP
ncbi:hypothetical protein [Burkholderia cepacia]|uniref:hypothetical protein n=1 Tax=Burkholderia cepacia TaxID=292 RepID=UPI001C9764F4|nr:hypothetical protein [Burkholderia cepacia]MBY4804633.1 hypothetical protein [Burkholderia cepacia]MCA8326733.1 hypothetical protein [Burkholderia cepacia]